MDSVVVCLCGFCVVYAYKIVNAGHELLETTG